MYLISDVHRNSFNGSCHFKARLVRISEVLLGEKERQLIIDSGFKVFFYFLKESQVNLAGRW